MIWPLIWGGVMRLSKIVAFVLALLPVAACADPSAPPHPLPHSTLVIDGANGPVKFDVEMANDSQSQEYGLMFRKSLAAKAGMLFDFHTTVMTTFWMKNTLIPLDMIFIKMDGTISSVAPDAVPMTLTPVASVEPVRAVLEIGGGRAAQFGIYPGEKVHNAIFGNAVK
jgi:uncharacterized membrane protein (UPF0127 family)